MKKKGFILMETIVVIVVITVSLVTIFSSYNKILTKLKKENKYDTSEYIYMTKHVKDYLQKDSINPNNISESTNVKEHSDKFSSDVKDMYGIKKIYVVEIVNGKIAPENFPKFDGYMIDYLRKLDISETTDLIIVEYERQAMSDGKYKHEYGIDSNKLYNTYIASLEW